MYPEMMADTSKLIDTNERQYFQKGHTYGNHNDDLDDNIDKYRTINQNNNDDHKNENVEKNDFDHRPTVENNHSAKDNSDKVQSKNEEENLTNEEKKLRNLAMLRKLGELKQNGVILSQNYNINSDYNSMKYEYELHVGIKTKRNTVQWMSNMMCAIVKGVELLNDKHNPFDLKLSGWSDNVIATKSDYYDVLGEIYEEYTGTGKKMNPILKLFLMLTSSVATIQLHKGIINSLPDRESKLEEDDEYIQKMRAKALQESKNENKFEEKMNEEANQQLRDLQYLKERELEIKRAERELEENNSNFNKFKSGLELSDTIRGSERRRTLTEQREYNRQEELVRQEFERQKREELLREKKKLEQFVRSSSKESSEKSSDTSSVMTTKSSKSKISVNRDLMNVLDNEMKSPKKAPKRVVKKAKNEFDSITIGSTKNKNKNGKGYISISKND